MNRINNFVVSLNNSVMHLTDCLDQVETGWEAALSVSISNRSQNVQRLQRVCRPTKNVSPVVNARVPQNSLHHASIHYVNCLDQASCASALHILNRIQLSIPKTA